MALFLARRLTRLKAALFVPLVQGYFGIRG